MDISIVQSVHRKLKYYKKKMKVYGRMKHDLRIARAALERIESHVVHWEFNENDTDGYIEVRSEAERALREMNDKKNPNAR